MLARNQQHVLDRLATLVNVQQPTSCTVCGWCNVNGNGSRFRCVLRYAVCDMLHGITLTYNCYLNSSWSLLCDTSKNTNTGTQAPGARTHTHTHSTGKATGGGGEKGGTPVGPKPKNRTVTVNWQGQGEQSDGGHTTRRSHKCTSFTFT